MGFKFVEYQPLKDRLLQSIRSLADHYRHDAKELIDAYAHDTANSKVLAVKYSKISEVRRTQISLLLTLIRCLDTSSKTAEEKKIPLNALAFYIRELINASYNPSESLINYFASYAVSAEHSFLFIKLTYSLELSSDDMPSNSELLNGYKVLKDFMESLIYLDPKEPTKGYLPVIPFSQEKIEKFNVEDFLKALIARIAVLEQQIIDATKEASLKRRGHILSGMGLFSEAPDDTKLKEMIRKPDELCVCYG